MFLPHYLHYASGNEAPPMFHVWSGYTCLAAAVSRKVWLPFEDTAIFPNIYTIFVGKAGNGKSWALAKAKRMLAEINVPMSRSVETPEGLWRFMNGNPKADPPIPSPVMFEARWPDGQIRPCHPITIIANEFANFIQNNQPGWILALCDIYDEDKYEYRTKNQGEDNLIGPYVCLLGAITTDVASDMQKARIISSGLARRTIFQHGERDWNNPIPRPRIDESQKAAHRYCVEYLRKLQSVYGEIRWGEGTTEWWDKWYCEHLATVPKQPPQTQGWFASKATQLLKIAILSSLSETLDLELKIHHFELSLGYLESMETGLHKIFGGVGRNELAQVAINILDYMENQGCPMLLNTLKHRFFYECKPPAEFPECLNYLVGEGLLQRFILQTNVAAIEIVGTPTQMQDWKTDGCPLPFAPRRVEAQTSSRPAVVPEAGPSPEPEQSPIS